MSIRKGRTMLQRINRAIFLSVLLARRDRNQRGEGLLSLLLWAGGVTLVIGGLSYVGFLFYKMFMLYTFNQAMVQTIQNTRNGYNGNYPVGNLWQPLIDKGQVPFLWNANGAGAGTVTHQYSGQV